MTRYSMFADEVVSATDLTRNTSDVLDQALRGPVTISRKSEQFALLSRTTASQMTRSLDAATLAIEHLEKIQLLKTAGHGQISSYSWMQVFDKDDLETLRGELTEVTHRVLCSEADPSEVGDLIHQWRESGLAIQSGVLDEVIHEPSPEKVPIPRPKEV